jgi:hypothetical protein
VAMEIKLTGTTSDYLSQWCHWHNVGSFIITSLYLNFVDRIVIGMLGHISFSIVY